MFGNSNDNWIRLQKYKCMQNGTRKEKTSIMFTSHTPTIKQSLKHICFNRRYGSSSIAKQIQIHSTVYKIGSFCLCV